MTLLHIAPGDSAGGSLRRAIRDAERDEQVLSWSDDLSCGPIATGEPSERAEWWAPIYGDREIEAELKSFWECVATTGDRLVVWFGRHSARELAFSLAWADRLRERPYDIIDVTGLRIPFRQADGSPALSGPMEAVSLINPDRLRSLLGSERPATDAYREECRQTWRRLQTENAPFRIVTAVGLVSAPADYFDRFILERATTEWRKVARIVGEVMACTDEPYMQVGDVMLVERVVALVGEGKLFAHGDLRNMRYSEVRLPP